MKAHFLLFHAQPFCLSLHQPTIEESHLYQHLINFANLPSDGLHIEDTRLKDVCEITLDEVRVGIVVFSDD